MSRRPRKTSSTGIYHLMAKGVGNQIIFEDRKDRLKFLYFLKKYSEQLEISIFAYCLMDNHIHLLIKDNEKNVSLFMQKVEISYAYYFNLKYRRTGPLFNGRFQSEVVEDEVYLLTVFRYIIRNPEKAGIAKYYDYEWSSYSDCLKVRKENKISEIDYLIEIIGSIEMIMRFLSEEKDDPDCLELQERKFLGFDEEKAKEIIKAKLHITTGVLIRSFERVKRNKALRLLRKEGISIRQLERLTGVSRGIIQGL